MTIQEELEGHPVLASFISSVTWAVFGLLARVEWQGGERFVTLQRTFLPPEYAQEREQRREGP